MFFVPDCPKGQEQGVFLLQDGQTWGYLSPDQTKSKIEFNVNKYNPSDLAKSLHAFLLEQGKEGKPHTILGAESCTGGLISAEIVKNPGSSSYFWGSLIVYSNEAKCSLLGLDMKLIERFGAVSIEVVLGLLKGLMLVKPYCTAFAISGIAGPDGGSPSKPVGTVVVGVAQSSDAYVLNLCLTGTRESIQNESTCAVLLMLRSLIENSKVPGASLHSLL